MLLPSNVFYLVLSMIHFKFRSFRFTRLLFTSIIFLVHHFPFSTLALSFSFALRVPLACHLFPAYIWFQGIGDCDNEYS